MTKPSKPSEQSRVGKGRPAGSIELRVSPSPSKIPYGGFSPVRLQMDRQWRPSTTSRGLSAVHIRPMTPSYTPPQLPLPGIRDPRRDYPFENLSVQCGTTPSNSNTSIQRPLARQRVMLSRRVIAYYGLIRASESLPATYGFAAESAAPKENRLEVGIQRFPNLLRWTGLACRLPYPGAPKSANDCYFLFGFSLHLRVTGSAITLRVSRLQSSLRADFALMLRPASWLALLSRTFTFELAQPGHPESASNMTTWVNSQFPRPDFHRQVQRHYGLQDGVCADGRSRHLSNR